MAERLAPALDAGPLDVENAQVAICHLSLRLRVSQMAAPRSGGLMSRALVVEDSPDHAKMIRFLLESGGLKVEHVNSGLRALEAIERGVPDILVTDLMMPGMNGLELVETLGASHPCLPIVLITAFGNEDIAAQALRHGAASYIPKKQLAEELLSTVENILAVGASRRERNAVLKHIKESGLHFELENDLNLIPPLVGFLEEILHRQFEISDEGQVFKAGIALGEALMNAIHHGNLEIDSELRERDPAAYNTMVRQRLKQAPYKDRRVHIVARLSRSQARFSVRDEGPGFDTSRLPNPTDPSNLLKLSGRGLYLITTFMDQVTHNQTGNEITMVKKFNGVATESAPTP